MHDSIVKCPHVTGRAVAVYGPSEAVCSVCRELSEARVEISRLRRALAVVQIANEALNRKPVPDDLIAPTVAAEVLGVAVQTLNNWRSTGTVKLPYHKIGGGVRYSRSEILKFVRQPTN
jgi:hypothetical protein